MTTAKPEPIIDVWNKVFWEECAQGRLVLQRCSATGKYWYPPGPNSPFAPRASWEWASCSGRGEVLSWVVFHQKYFEGFAADLPYVVAMVRLEEGATILANIVGPRDSIRVGAAVEVQFEPRGNGCVPVFQVV